MTDSCARLLHMVLAHPCDPLMLYNENCILVLQRDAAMTELPPNKWTPLTGMPEGAEEWEVWDYDRLQEEWAAVGRKLADCPESRLEHSPLNLRLNSQKRLFAIETGQIEGLYTLRRGVAADLMTEGFARVRGSETLEGLSDRTIRGLLEDQREAIDRAQETIRKGDPLSHEALFDWHALLTRHQEFLTGRTPDGQFVKAEFPQSEKGAYKTRPNNPRQPDGQLYEYCPPEQSRLEMDRMFDLYRDIHERRYPVAAEAAWLHHRFVRTHPFCDGNGRMARLLMAYAYMRRGLPLPLIDMEDRSWYIFCLEKADRGDLRLLADFMQGRAGMALSSFLLVAEDTLMGDFRVCHANGGVTSNGRYYPPGRIKTSWGSVAVIDPPLASEDELAEAKAVALP